VSCMAASVTMSVDDVVGIVAWYGKIGWYVQPSPVVFLLYKHGGIGSSCAHYTASAEMRGLMRDGQRKFSVVYACFINRHHRCIGKAGSRLASTENIVITLVLGVALGVG